MDIVLLMGQSNAKGCGNPEKSEQVRVPAYEYLENFTGNACISLGVTLQLSDGRGTIAPAFANAYYELTKREVCFVHCAMDVSRIKNWNHDLNQFLNQIIEKCIHGKAYLEKEHTVERIMAIWMQGESDAKYGTDPVYYKEQLIKLGDQLVKEAGVEQVFVSQVGYWDGEERNLRRCRLIGAAQELACEASDNLTMINKSAYGYYKQGLLRDDVHYSMKALNLHGQKLAEKIASYYNGTKDLEVEVSEDLTAVKEFVTKMELLEEMI